MASITSDGNGNRTIQFVAADKKRRSIRLGKVPKKLAEAVKLRVEALNAAAITRLPWDADLAAWVAGIGEQLAAKLAAVKLIPLRESRKLKEFLDNYIAGRAGDGATKPATLITIHRVSHDLVDFFKAGADLRGINTEEAEKFKKYYQDKGLAPATSYRRLKMAKMLFGFAMKLKLVSENPFANVRGKNINPTGRRYHLSLGDTLTLLRVANPSWRIIIALARLAGLRTPSETLSLRWEHVNFSTGRMSVPEPKNERHEGRGTRIVPIFAALRPYLEEARKLAAPGEVYVVGGATGETYREAGHGPNGWMGSNLRTTFLKIIDRAGLTPWPKLFQNLRSSCETDLMQYHPIHVVTAWLGNTPKIALGHYLQTLDRDFEKAIGGASGGAELVQNRVLTPADTDRHQNQKSVVLPGNAGDLTAPVLSSPELSYCTGGQGGT